MRMLGVGVPETLQEKEMASLWRAILLEGIRLTICTGTVLKI